MGKYRQWRLVRIGRGWAVLLVLGTVAAIIGWLEPSRFLSLAYLQSEQAQLQHFRHAHPVIATAGFFAGYVLLAALSIPVEVILTLAAGAIFGWWWGSVIVSFASTVGATLAMLASRYLFRDVLTRHFGERLRTINTGIENDGAFYLLAARLAPIFPFVLVNVLMGLTPMRVWTFAWVSQLGMLAGTLAYVGAGTQLAQLDSLRDILSPMTLGTFALLAVLPAIGRSAIRFVAERRL